MNAVAVLLTKPHTPRPSPFLFCPGFVPLVGVEMQPAGRPARHVEGVVVDPSQVVNSPHSRGGSGSGAGASVDDSDDDTATATAAAAGGDDDASPAAGAGSDSDDSDV